MTNLFVLNPPRLDTLLATLTEAGQLSFNFAYISPLALPSLAPGLHPMVEAIFNIVVAFAVLQLGFVAEDIRTEEESNQKAVSASPLLLAALFFTNIFFLPFLALRTPPTSYLESVPASKRNALQVAAESWALPAVALAMVLVSVPWALFARPEYGPLAERWQSFVVALDSDILVHSFAVDVLVYSIFQAWLVRDDARRRKWRDGDCVGLVRAATFVPFFGLVAYLFGRARWARIGWDDRNEKESDAIS